VVIPVLLNHAPMLGRTLLYTALTRARRLVIIVGQKRALALAVKDWRHATRHTAPEGLLTDPVQYAWPRSAEPNDIAYEELEGWEGLTGGSMEP
jgi:hypothetical protein